MIDQDVFASSGSAPAALSEPQCRRLLATRTLGHVGLTSGALPVILPVEYVYSEGTIVFRTDVDEKLRAALHGAVLAFEVDELDPVTARGWSVLVHGRATVLTKEDELALMPTSDVSLDESRHHYVRLHCELVSGRRLAPGENGRGYEAVGLRLNVEA